MEPQNQEKNSYTDLGTAQNHRFWFDLWIQEGSGVLSVCKRTASLLMFPAGAFVCPTPIKTRLPRHDRKSTTTTDHTAFGSTLGVINWGLGLGFQFRAAQPYSTLASFGENHLSHPEPILCTRRANEGAWPLRCIRD